MLLYSSGTPPTYQVKELEFDWPNSYSRIPLISSSHTAEIYALEKDKSLSDSFISDQESCSSDEIVESEQGDSTYRASILELDPARKSDLEEFMEEAAHLYELPLSQKTLYCPWTEDDYSKIEVIFEYDSGDES